MFNTPPPPMTRQRCRELAADESARLGDVPCTHWQPPCDSTFVQPPPSDVRSSQTSVQRVALCVQAYYSENTESVNDFLEHAIVRNELADNFCFYNPLYDSVKGTSNWAQKTLDDHRKDKRSHIYTQDELAQARTHDDIWNSAQLQMVKEGKMHTFLRMYWCKKILEWTPSPEDALKYAIYWNDHYSIDGLNPKGYVGCMWSICGLHDQAFAERSVFGKVRFMNYEGCKRKFNVNAFVARNGGKVHKYVPKK
ncbi:deoxyribodipyrimidine photo-lyase [Choristoneura fumiferana]|uniref:deoxyribodipyrimidine photo-lyase n=1 Tax=Choristoneura fumiferana TaxID=7141 RepID=UPI003D154F4D